MENQTKEQLTILESNLIINLTGCKEDNLQSNVIAIIEGIKGALQGVPINLQINLYTPDGNLQIQNQTNLTSGENEKWNN